MGWGTRSVVIVAAAIAGCGRVGFDPAGGDGAAAPVVGFAFGTSLTDEAAGTHHVNLTLSAATASDVTVDVHVAGGTATQGPDFALDATTVTIPAGATQGVVDLVIVNDGLDETDETIELTLGNPVNARLGASAHTVTISNQVLPRVGFAAATSNALENAGGQQFVVTLDALAPTDVKVAYSIGGTATSDDHGFVNGMLTIPAGQLAVQVAGEIADDLLDEDDETIELTLSAQSGAVVGAVDRHTHTIVDQDPPPTAAFEVASSAHPEALGDIAIQVRLSAPSGKPVAVHYMVTGGTATDPDDYSLPPDTLTFAPGTVAQLIIPAPVNDTLDENDETVVITLTGATNATLGTISTHTWTIADDDAPSQLAFATAAATVPEAAGTLGVAVVLDKPSGKAISFTVTAAGGTADGSDFAITGGVYNIPAGSTSTGVPVTIIQDSVAEPTEDFTLALSTPTNATIGAPGTETISILDDDGSGLQVRFNPSESDDSAAEGNGTGSTLHSYTVVLSAPAPSTLTVDFTVTGTAGPSDRVITSSPLTFSAGSTSQTITVGVVGDALTEPNETVILTLTGATTGVTIASPSTRTHTIVNDD